MELHEWPNVCIDEMHKQKFIEYVLKNITDGLSDNTCIFEVKKDYCNYQPYLHFFPRDLSNIIMGYTYNTFEINCKIHRRDVPCTYDGTYTLIPGFKIFIRNDDMYINFEIHIKLSRDKNSISVYAIDNRKSEGTFVDYYVPCTDTCFINYYMKTHYSRNKFIKLDIKSLSFFGCNKAAHHNNRFKKYISTRNNVITRLNRERFNIKLVILKILFDCIHHKNLS